MTTEVVCEYRFDSGWPCHAAADHAVHHGKWVGPEPNHSFIAASVAQPVIPEFYEDGQRVMPDDKIDAEPVVPDEPESAAHYHADSRAKWHQHGGWHRHNTDLGDYATPGGSTDPLDIIRWYEERLIEQGRRAETAEAALSQPVPELDVERLKVALAAVVSSPASLRRLRPTPDAFHTTAGMIAAEYAKLEPRRATG